MPSTKAKIRSIERLLRNKNLGDEATGTLRAQMEVLRSKNDENVRKERERQIATKYHKVKFVERKKITRKIRQLEKNSTSDSKGSAGECQEDDPLYELYCDLAYIMYFPKAMKYISLKSDEDDTVSSRKKKEARALALQAWKNDKKVGKDSVKHAMLVEYGLQEEKGDEDKPIGGDKAKSAKRKRDESTATSTQKITKKVTVSKEASAIVDHSSSSDGSIDSSDDDSKNSVNENDSENESESGSESENELAVLQGKSIAKQAKVDKATKKRTLTKADTMDIECKDDIAPDPFFIEEVLVPRSSLHEIEKFNYKALPFSEKYAAKSGRNGFDKKSSFGSKNMKGGRQPTTPGAIKQQQRLDNWKQKRKAKFG